MFSEEESRVRLLDLISYLDGLRKGDFIKNRILEAAVTSALASQQPAGVGEPIPSQSDEG